MSTSKASQGRTSPQKCIGILADGTACFATAVRLEVKVHGGYCSRCLTCSEDRTCLRCDEEHQRKLAEKSDMDATSSARKRKGSQAIESNKSTRMDKVTTHVCNCTEILSLVVEGTHRGTPTHPSGALGVPPCLQGNGHQPFEGITSLPRSTKIQRLGIRDDPRGSLVYSLGCPRSWLPSGHSAVSKSEGLLRIKVS